MYGVYKYQTAVYKVDTLELLCFMHQCNYNLFIYRYADVEMTCQYLSEPWMLIYLRHYSSDENTETETRHQLMF